MTKRPPSDNMSGDRKRRRCSSSSSSSSSDEVSMTEADSDGFIQAVEYRLNTYITDIEKEFLRLANKRTRNCISIDLNNFRAFKRSEQNKIIDTLRKVKNRNEADRSYLLKVLCSTASIETKSHIVRKIEQSDTAHDNTKILQYVEGALKLPLGKYSPPAKNSINQSKEMLDKYIYGQDLAKNKFLQVLAQRMSNPASNCSVIGLVGCPGSGKCFAIDTPILMYDGSIKKVQDVIVGDMVMGDDSTPRNVLSLGRGSDTMYKISPEIGESYTVNSEHILCLKWGTKPRIFQNNNKWFIDYFDATKIKKKTKRLSNQEEGYQFLKDIEYTPYINIEVNRYLKLGGYIRRRLKGYGTVVNFPTQEVSTAPYDYGMNLNTDGIPDEYKINDKTNRLELLAGILDGDNRNDNFNIIVDDTKPKLLEDIIYLCRSLGINVDKTKGDTYTRLILRTSGQIFTEIPTKITRNKPLHCPNEPLVQDIRVSKVGHDNYYGFTLDGNHKFLLGSMTVTHNTMLVQEGISRIMGKPFIYIPLGGCSDISYLTGFSYCWEGSHPGKIADSLMKAGVMDPVFYFDELDKVSSGWRGDEIINCLIQLVDIEQNSRYEDRYFQGIEMDLSRATFIFSYNDRSKISYILRDRITEIEVNNYKTADKINIAQKYMLPKIYKDIGLKSANIIFEEGLLDYIIENYTFEGGVRKFKQRLYEVLREINLRHISGKVAYKFPITITKKMIRNDLLLKFSPITPYTIHSKPVVGKINGMYATCAGTGGILPIEASYYPANKKFDFKITGMLGQMMEESVKVAITLAWYLVPQERKIELNKLWDTEGSTVGVHIHCPTGSNKDGNSAGVALTMVILSLFTNKPIDNTVAMTGEVSLLGDVMEIGGLRDKLSGSKKEGIVKALYPTDNHKDIKRIRDDLPNLIDSTFTVKPISRIEQVIPYVFGT